MCVLINVWNGLFFNWLIRDPLNDGTSWLVTAFVPLAAASQQSSHPGRRKCKKELLSGGKEARPHSILSFLCSPLPFYPLRCSEDWGLWGVGGSAGTIPQNQESWFLPQFVKWTGRGIKEWFLLDSFCTIHLIPIPVPIPPKCAKMAKELESQFLRNGNRLSTSRWAAARQP